MHAHPQQFRVLTLWAGVPTAWCSLLQAAPGLSQFTGLQNVSLKNLQTVRKLRSWVK